MDVLQLLKEQIKHPVSFSASLGSWLRCLVETIGQQDHGISAAGTWAGVLTLQGAEKDSRILQNLRGLKTRMISDGGSG